MIAPMSSATDSIARFVRASTPADLPAEAAGKSRKIITDTVAVMLAGAGSEVAPPLFKYLQLVGGAGSSRILGSQARASAESAALVNGAFGHALDFDDVLSMMPAHPSAIILAALTADLDRHPLSGRALIEAHMIGLEVGGKIGLGIGLEHYHRGFHGTGTLGIFCAVAALARAWALEAEAIRTALGIASSMASGLRCNFGTMTKPLHTGWAARSALAAVQLAVSGLTAATNALEADAGFFAAFGTPRSDPQRTARALGKPWVILDPGVALKKFPCCYASHRAMDGVLTLRRKLGFTAADVARLICRMPPGGMQALTYRKPVTGLEAKFSLEYALAAGCQDGAYTLWTFTDEAVRRPEIAALTPRVFASEDPRCRGDDPEFEARSSGSRGYVEVIVELGDGTREAVRIDRAPGHPLRELSWHDLELKFRDCARHAGITEDRARAAFGSLQELEQCADVRELIDRLCR
jgi:2-methylcitrate dehydratase PrpD